MATTHTQLCVLFSTKLPAIMQVPVDRGACMMAPTNIISQWLNEWKLAPVVNSSLVDDPTIWQPGFDLPRCYWALLNHFHTNQATVHPVERSGALQQLTCAIVTNVKWWHILSHIAAPLQSKLDGSCSDCTQLMMLLAWMACKCTWQQQQQHAANLGSKTVQREN